MSSDAAYVVASLALTGATATWSICLLGVLVRGSAVLWYVAAAPLCAVLTLFLVSYAVAAMSDPGAVPSSHATIRETNASVQPPHMRPDVTGKWSAAVAPWMSAGLMVQTAASKREGANAAKACVRACADSVGCYCGEAINGVVLPYKLSKAKALFRDVKSQYQSVSSLGGFGGGSGSDRGEVGGVTLMTTDSEATTDGEGGSDYVLDFLKYYKPEGSETLSLYWCKQCLHLKPLRSHHCKRCDRCVLRMDHHCVWINNCVGYGNHKSFLLMVLYAALASAYGLAINIVFVIRSVTGAIAIGPDDDLGPALADVSALMHRGARIETAGVAPHHAAARGAAGGGALPWLHASFSQYSQLAATGINIALLAAYCVFVLKMIVIQSCLVAHGRTYIEHRCCEGVMLGCTFDHGPVRNWVGVFGRNWWLWWSPLAKPAHDELAFFPSKPPPAAEPSSVAAAARGGGGGGGAAASGGVVNYIMKRI